MTVDFLNGRLARICFRSDRLIQIGWRLVLRDFGIRTGGTSTNKDASPHLESASLRLVVILDHVEDVGDLEGGELPLPRRSFGPNLTYIHPTS
jgi:hypothetical protein